KTGPFVLVCVLFPGRNRSRGKRKPVPSFCPVRRPIVHTAPQDQELHHSAHAWPVAQRPASGRSRNKLRTFPFALFSLARSAPRGWHVDRAWLPEFLRLENV